MILARRSFLTGLASALAAPAIVRATSLMPVKRVDFDLLTPTQSEMDLIRVRLADAYVITCENMARYMYGDGVASSIPRDLWHDTQ